jgi:hypothetical protein
MRSPSKLTETLWDLEDKGYGVFERCEVPETIPPELGCMAFRSVSGRHTLLWFGDDLDYVLISGEASC